MLKNADYVKKQHIFVYPCAVTIFFRNIWWNLIIENFCLGLYVEVATRMRYYTNIIKEKKLRVRSAVVYSVSVSCCNNDNSGPRGGGV